MTYAVELTASASRQLAKIPLKDRLRIAGAIELLAVDPFPPRAVRLKGRDGWRIRVGDYRVIYAVDGRLILVTVLKIGHRSDVYHGG